VFQEGCITAILAFWRIRAARTSSKISEALTNPSLLSARSDDDSDRL
jgi:hypothetical protein